MPSTAGSSDRGRYIVQAIDTEQLVDFINEVNEDPAMQLLNTIGPADRPHTVVVEMNHEKARSLEPRFRTSNKLKIEPARPLSLFN